jgi:hypothetical protein
MSDQMTGPCDPGECEECDETLVNPKLMIKMRLIEEHAYNLVALIGKRDEDGLNPILTHDDIAPVGDAAGRMMAGIQDSPLSNRDAEARILDATMVLAQVARAAVEGQYHGNQVKEDSENLRGLFFHLEAGKDLVMLDPRFFEDNPQFRVGSFDEALSRLGRRIQTVERIQY